MSERFVLAIDQGTTSTRAIVFDQFGQQRAVGRRDITQNYPFPGAVEHDPNELWESVVDAAKSACYQSGIHASMIATIGITNQRETTLIWDAATGEPIYPAIVWQSRQTESLCEQYRKQGLETVIRERTGLVIDPYFSATKARFILDNVPGAVKRAADGELRLGTVDSWLLWKMTKGQVHATDATNASRTMLYNIHTGDWDDELLRLFDIPRSMMPRILNCSDDYGTTRFLDEQVAVPIGGVAGDQHAALYGQGCRHTGSVKNTYGTGCFLMMQLGHAPTISRHGLLTTLAWQLDGQRTYALEGSVFIAGAAIQWLRDELHLLTDASQSAQMAREADDQPGLYFVPAFVGLGAPYWDSDARGALYGLTRGTTQAHLVRSALEAIAYQTRDVLSAMEQDAGIAISEIRVDGGASTNDWLMQFQADILPATVVRPTITETTALGAALLAGRSVGLWLTESDSYHIQHAERSFQPSMSDSERRQRVAGWSEAVERTRSRPQA